MDMLDEADDEKTEYTYATFKTTRIVTARSVELPAKGEMQTIIAHRFGRVDGGWRNFFGIDQANMRIGFEYGAFDWLSVGFGRSNVEGTYDFYARAKVLRQSKGAKKMPFTVVWQSGFTVTSNDRPATREVDAVLRMGYFHQIAIARKFNSVFSLQIMPTFHHRNLTLYENTRNSVWSIGVGTRVKVSKSMSINLEYFQPIPGEETFLTLDGSSVTRFRGTMSIGIDIETGGHVFQVMLSNSQGMIDQMYIGQAQGYFWDGDIHLGFNINRIFSVVNYEKRHRKKEAKALKKEQAL